MTEEKYSFDEPIGLYGYESRERLAGAVMKDLVRYEEMLEVTVDPLAELPYLGVPYARPDEFRLGSLVESETARIGYGLAVAKPGPDQVNMGGIFFRVDRGAGPSVEEDKLLAVASPITYTGHEDYKAQVEGLMHDFDRGELEAIMRMLGKMTASLDLASSLRGVEEDKLAGLSIPAQMKRDADIKRKKSTLARLSLVEPYVHFALRNYSKKDLNAMYPVEYQPRIAGEVSNQSSDSIHIVEWQDFMTTAEELLANEASSEQAASHVNIQHEIDGKLYYVKLATENGRLFGAQMLCDNTGAWKSQRFDLDEADDDSGRNIVGSFWDKDEILACLRNGEVIDDESYEYYRLLAEDSLKTEFEKPANVIQIDAIKKRPAA